ncbi:autotransporter assembly complex protein TamB [Vibrio sp. WJH972]
MIKAMFRVSKWLFISTVLLILLIFLLSVGLLYTESGLRLATWGVEKSVPELTIGKANGVLGRSFSLNHVEYHRAEPKLDFSVESLSLALEAKCLFQPAICLNSVQASGVSFDMPKAPDSEEENEPTEPLKLVKAPLPIRIDGIELNDISLMALGNKVSWKQFSTGIEWRRSKLTVSNTEWRDIDVHVATTDSDQTEEKKSNSPIVLPEVWVPLNIDVTQFNMERFTLHQDTPVVVNELTFSVSAFQNDIELTGFALDMPEVDVSANGNISLKESYPLEFELSSIAKLEQAKGQSVKARLSGSLEKLELDLALSDQATGDIRGQVQLLEPKLPFHLSIDQLKGQWPIVSQSADVKVDDINGEISGSLDKFTLSLRGDVSGNAFPDTSLELQGSGSQTNIDLPKIYLATLGGDVEGRVTASWGDSIEINTNLTLDKIQPDQHWPEIPGLIGGHLVASASIGGENAWQTQVSTLDIQGDLLNYPLDVNGVLEGVQTQAGAPIQLSTSGLTFAHGENKIFASGELAQQWDMDVDLMIPDIDKSIPNLAGQVNGKIQLRGDTTEPQVDLDVSANDIDWQDQIKIASATLKGKVWPLHTPSADVLLAMDTVDYQREKLDQVDVHLAGELAKHAVYLTTEAPWGKGELEITGQLDQEMTKWVGELHQFVLESEPSRLYLEKPTSVIANITDQEITVDAHCWRESEASLCLQERSIFSAEKSQARWLLSNFNFSQIQQVIPEYTELDGDVNADILVEYESGEAPKLDANVKFGKGKVVQQLSEPVTVGWDDVSLQINVAENKLVSSGRINLTDNGDIQLNAEVSGLDIDDKTVDGQFHIDQVTLEALGPLLGDYGHVNAVVNGQVDLNGSLLQPQILGQLAITNIAAEGEVTPFDISDGQFSIRFLGYQAELEAGLVTEDGQLNVTGDADWQNIDKWTFNSHIFADELNIKVPPMVDIKSSPDINFSMTPQKVTIAGDINLPWGEIVVEELPESATKVSSDLVIVDENLTPIEEKHQFPFEIDTNIRVNIGDEFSIEAFGLSGNLTGLLNVTQRDNSPFVTGEVNIVNGTYSSFGQDLVIKKGQILMHGPVDQPYVSITAIRNPDNIEDDVEAGIKVTGSADAPSVTVYSEPVMAQANALSYLLRGQDLETESDDSSSSSNTVTSTLIGLSLAQSGKVVGELGQAFGVDDLQLDTAGSGDDSQVTVSGYVLPGLQVKYGVGIFTSVGEFTVRYRLMKNFYVEAVSGLNSAVDLLYQFEFD